MDTGAAKPTIVAARDAYVSALPGLKRFCDSIEHAEDRLRGRNKRGDPLVIAPLNTPVIYAPQGALMAGTLHGRLFGWTAEDGTFAEVEVSDATVEGRSRCDTGGL